MAGYEKPRNKSKVENPEVNVHPDIVDISHAIYEALIPPGSLYTPEEADELFGGVTDMPTDLKLEAVELLNGTKIHVSRVEKDSFEGLFSNRLCVVVATQAAESDSTITVNLSICNKYENAPGSINYDLRGLDIKLVSLDGKETIKPMLFGATFLFFDYLREGCTYKLEAH